MMSYIGSRAQTSRRLLGCHVWKNCPESVLTQRQQQNMHLARGFSAFARRNKLHVCSPRSTLSYLRAPPPRLPRPPSRPPSAPLSHSSASSTPPLPLETLLSTLPRPPSSFLPEIQEHLRQSTRGGRRRKLVVVDDDPTGTQSVQGFPVLSEWTAEALAREIEDDSTPGFFLLSNIRALSARDAEHVLREIRTGLDAALKRLNRSEDSVTIISRSDSTLRGHFPLDVEVLCPHPPLDKEGTESQARMLCGGTSVLTLVAPFFQAGGRMTINDVHYMTTSPASVLPVHLTPFAQDKAFGFSTSNLKDWVAQKLGGGVKAEDVASITLDDIRRSGPTGVRDKLLSLARSNTTSLGTYVVVNAVTREDLECVILGSLQAEDAGLEVSTEGEPGIRMVYRTAADWVAVRAGLSPLPPLPASALRPPPDLPSHVPSAEGGLIVVGSYVPKSSEQLSFLLENGGKEQFQGIEICVDTLFQDEAARLGEMERVTAAVEEGINAGKHVVIFTSRQLRQEDGAGGLISGMKVSDSVVEIVKNLRTRPLFLIAKGGITSNDVAVKGLGLKRAMVLGPILPGVPVWECGEESKFPGMKYVVFPGNVGSSEALFEAAQKLCLPPSASTPPSPDSKTSLALCVTPTRPVFASSSRTLDLLEAARAKGEAVGAFNVYNLEGVRAVVRAAAATNSSAILQVHPSSLEFGGQPLLELCRAGRFFVEEMGTMRGSKEKDTIAVHLDHANEAAVIEQVLATQLVDSVMCDGSAKPYEENVSWTAQMTRLAHSKGIPVEAELGRLAGEEDGLSVQEKEAKMTDPLQVPDFVEQTDIDMVAVTIGNVHGRYATNPPVLDLARLADIRAATDRLLVLHGASGLPPKVVHATIAIGAICKFNVNTEVREAAMQVIREGKAKDVLPLMQTTGEAMQRVIENKMRLFKASPSI